MNKLNSSISFIETYSLVSENFLGQTSHLLDRLRNYVSIKPHHRKTIILLLFVWLMASTLLLQFFTSVLLNVYTIKKPSLTVQTLEDIVNNPDLLVAGYKGLKEIEPYKLDLFDALEERVKNYHKTLKMSLYDIKELHKRELIKDIIARKSVLISSTFVTNMLKLFNPDANIMESEHKFFSLLKYGLVSKKFSKHKEIYVL